MAAKPSVEGLLDRLIGWQGAPPPIRAQLLRSLCTGVRLRSLLSNSITLLILTAMIIAETRDPAHAAWVLTVIAGGLLPRLYALHLRRQERFEPDPERPALVFVAISAAYGLLWGIGPFLMLPVLSGPSAGIFLFIMVFGTIMGPYAVMPGILYVRLITTGLPTLLAVALYSAPKVLIAALVVSIWLVLRTDVWRGYHRALRQQFELQQTLERRHEDLEAAHRSNQAANRALQRMAETDALTGAGNRRQLMQHLAILHGPAALILFDIDRFKAVNDRYGHPVGDAVLVSIVRLVQDNLRKNDLLARLGGEEFAIVLHGADADSAHALAERIREQIAAQPLSVDGYRVPVTISLGVAALAADADAGAPAQLLRQADRALYRAKHEGRNRTASAAESQPLAEAALEP